MLPGIAEAWSRPLTEIEQAFPEIHCPADRSSSPNAEGTTAASTWARVKQAVGRRKNGFSAASRKSVVGPLGAVRGLVKQGLSRMGYEIRRLPGAQSTSVQSPDSPQIRNSADNSCSSGSTIAGRDKVAEYFLRHYEFSTILDVGCGRGDAFPALAAKGAQVTGIDILPSDLVAQQVDGHQVTYICQDFMRYELERRYDAVFCSHVIEHMPDTELFLRKFFSFLKPEGVFCIVWPPPKSTTVGGHVHVFNMGLMLYNLVRLGIDCRSVATLRCQYCLAVMGHCQTFELPQLAHDAGDLERLAGFFPFQAYQGFDGNDVPGLRNL
jgi:2-polyprenyl-3-methyl-5-hydroxy-6-metoxy-1,4-benzoquinol methylase